MGPEGTGKIYRPGERVTVVHVTESGTTLPTRGRPVRPWRGTDTYVTASPQPEGDTFDGTKRIVVEHVGIGVVIDVSRSWYDGRLMCTVTPDPR